MMLSKTDCTYYDPPDKAGNFIFNNNTVRGTAVGNDNPFIDNIHLMKVQITNNLFEDTVWSS